MFKQVVLCGVLLTGFQSFADRDQQKACAPDENRRYYTVDDEQFKALGLNLTISPNPACLQPTGGDVVRFTVSNWHEGDDGHWRQQVLTESIVQLTADRGRFSRLMPFTYEAIDQDSDALTPGYECLTLVHITEKIKFRLPCFTIR